MTKPDKAAECPPESHKLHMCALKAKGMMAEIDQLSNKPTVVCGKCGAKANSGANLCNPKPL
jgi:transcription elongation factor Elf1